MSSSTKFNLTPLPNPQPKTLIIDGERYHVCYQKATADGGWEDQTISKKNQIELEKAIDDVFKQSRTEIRDKARAVKAGEEIALSFKKHKFTNLTFTKNSGKQKSYKLDQIFNSTLKKGSEKRKTEAVYNHLNKVELALSEDEAEEVSEEISELSSIEEESVEEEGSLSDEEPLTPNETVPFIHKECGANGDCGPFSLIDQLRIKGYRLNGTTVTCDPASDKNEARSLAQYLRDQIAKEIAALGKKIKTNKPLSEEDKYLIGLLNVTFDEKDKNSRNYTDSGKNKILQALALKKSNIQFSKGTNRYFDEFTLNLAVNVIKNENKDKPNIESLKIAIIRPSSSVKFDNSIHEIFPKYSTTPIDSRHTLFVYYPNEAFGNKYQFEHFQSIAPKKAQIDYNMALEELVSSYEKNHLEYLQNEIESIQSEDRIQRRLVETLLAHRTVYDAIGLYAYRKNKENKDEHLKIDKRTSPREANQKRIHYAYEALLTSKSAIMNVFNKDSLPFIKGIMDEISNPPLLEEID